MLSGMARITISLAVILMETTGEAEWGIPIFLTVMAAKWTGDLFNKGIYDIHIDLRHVPLLEHRPEKHELGLQASDIMATGVTSIFLRHRVGDLVDTLESCRHGAFPVLEEGTRRFIGILDRCTLLQVLHLGKQHGIFSEKASGEAANAMIPYEEMLRDRHPAPLSFAKIKASLTSEDYAREVDLRPYVNMGCYTVQEHAAVMRCHLLFRTMGLRHLPVLGADHTVRGIITRKDLLLAAEEHDVAAISACKTLGTEGVPVDGSDASSSRKANAPAQQAEATAEVAVWEDGVCFNL